MKQKKNEEASTSFVSMTGRYGGKARHLSKGQHLTAVSDHREASLVRRPIGDLIYGTDWGPDLWHDSRCAVAELQGSGVCCGADTTRKTHPWHGQRSKHLAWMDNISLKKK